MTASKFAGERTERRDVRCNGHKTVIRIKPSVWSAFVKLTKQQGTTTQREINGFRVNDPANDLPAVIERYIEDAGEIVYQYENRSAWLDAIVDAMRPIFAERGHPLPAEIRATMGFPSTGYRGKARGECWPASKSGKGWTEIFIHPCESEPLRIVNILTHELVHAADDCKSKHGKRFKTIGEAMDLEGKPKHMLGGAVWEMWARPILEAAGPMPHSALAEAVAKEKKQTTRMLKCECPVCEIVWRTAKTGLVKILDNGGNKLRCIDPDCKGKLLISDIIGDLEDEEGEEAPEEKAPPKRKRRSTLREENGDDDEEGEEEAQSRHDKHDYPERRRGA